MKDSTKLKSKLINIGIAEDNVGKSKLLSDCAVICNTSLIDGLSYEECEQGLATVVFNHMTADREVTLSIVKSITEGDFEGHLGMFEYAWGDYIFPCDALRPVYSEYDMIKANIFDGHFTQEYLEDVVLKDLKYFKMGLTESDLEEFTQTELKSIIDECLIVFKRRWKPLDKKHGIKS
ncbi:MAG: hypothetical protein GY861_25125 [bacterium]|nr:hypothetical protein [bacterium]